MSERIGRLNGATRAEKHDCDDEQVFHDGLLVVVTQKDDGFDALMAPPVPWCERVSRQFQRAVETLQP